MSEKQTAPVAAGKRSRSDEEEQLAPTAAPPPRPSVCDCGWTKEELDAQMDKYDALVNQRRDETGASVAEAQEYFRVSFERTFCSQSEAWPRCSEHGRLIAEHPAATRLFQGAPLNEALALVDAARMRPHVLTDANTEYVGRAATMRTFAAVVESFHDPATLAARSNSKGQPIIATAATTGVGKSRLLHEIRKEYTALGYAVVVVTYNTAANLSPSPDEKACDDLAKVQRCFLSRLVSMMLPEECFVTSALATRFELTIDDAATLLAEKFKGRSVIILVDEVGQLAVRTPNENAMNEVISILGQLADVTSTKLASDGDKKCIAMFTALSQSVTDAAKTSSGRNIELLQLPLLGRADVSKLLETVSATPGMQSLVYAFSAGHARTVARCLSVKWVNGRPSAHHDLVSMLGNATDYATAMLTEAEVKAVLLGNSNASSPAVDFNLLSKRSLVVVAADDTVTTVPAFLFQWCERKQGSSTLAKDLRECLLAAWSHLFLADTKQGAGPAFEQFLWHYEAVRRALLAGQTMSAAQFLNMETAPAKWEKGEFQVTCIRETIQVPNPRSTKWVHFDVKGTVVSDVKRYEPEKSNFPKYDYFSGWNEIGAKATRAWGWQTKHGGGKVPVADKAVVSVFVTTKKTAAAAWQTQGWLVVARSDLERYLGSSMTAAAAALLHFPEKK